MKACLECGKKFHGGPNAKYCTPSCNKKHKKSMTPNPYHKQAVQIWFEYYKSRTGETYLMDGKQAASMKHLLKKIESKVKDRGMEVNEYNILNSLKGFLIAIQDKWILEHLDISIVNSSFNQIYAAAIKNNPLSGRLDDLIEKRYGTPAAG